MNKKKLTFVFFIIILSIISYSFLHNINSNTKHTKLYYYLGTVNEVTIFNTPKYKSEKLLSKCDSILKDIDNKMSTHIPASDVSKINKNAGNDFVKVSEDTFKVIEEAINYSNLSKGNFDITIGPIVNLWSIGTDSANIPSDSDIANYLHLVDYNNIILDENNKSIKLSKNNMKIDLGAIAKGYAADRIATYLNSEGVDRALINLGGNIYALGEKDKNIPFSIGIQDPTKPRGNSIGNINTSNKSIVTSGIYERYIEKDGQIYHHMLNPSTGYPFDNELSSVTIISDKSVVCDALSTSAFGLGLNEGLKLIESLDNTDAIFITKDKKIYLTKGIENKFNLTDNTFNIVN